MPRLEPYRAEWGVAFERERHRLQPALRGTVDVIEHIGSTAVPGLRAKPILDLAARIVPRRDALSLAPALDRLGYRQHRSGPTTHDVYLRSSGGERTHILHLFTAGAWDLCPQRLFRDRLRRDPSARDAYAELKMHLATALDGRAYTAAKTEFIQAVIDEERLARGLEPVSVWDKGSRGRA